MLPSVPAKSHHMWSVKLQTWQTFPCFFSRRSCMHQDGHDSGGRFRATCGHVPAALRRGSDGCWLCIRVKEAWQIRWGTGISDHVVMTAWSAKFWYKWHLLVSHPSHNSTHCRAELCSKLLCSSHKSLVPLNLLSKWIPSFRQPEYTLSSPHKTQEASEYIMVLLYLGICCRGHQRRRKVKELQWLLGVLVMAEAFRRRRRSKTSLLAFTLPQTLQSQILTVFIFTAYLPQNSRKHLLRRLTFIFSIWLCQLSP